MYTRIRGMSADFPFGRREIHISSGLMVFLGGGARAGRSIASIVRLVVVDEIRSIDPSPRSFPFLFSLSLL